MVHRRPQVLLRREGWAVRKKLAYRLQPREYVYVAIDDHGRTAYAKVLDHRPGPTCAAFMERAVARFAGRGGTARA
jgi:hypothetical protein